ncbi:MAG TPA: sigma-70 family RNA polymerase sigma factor [Alphaproteobacteria bacterium]|nr:sigma-70 family RNA polymerase sigma factor [Alphaproteobacteria bacterium]
MASREIGPSDPRESGAQDAAGPRRRAATPLDETYALIVAEIPRLRRYARFLVRDQELADDLVQECLTRAVAKLDTWEIGSNMRAWLFVILHNAYISHWRRVKRSPTTVEMSPSDPALAVVGSQEQHLGMIDVQTAFNKLGEDHKQILLMVGVEGLRYEDAAAVLDLPVGTVRSRLFRARSALRQLLDGTEPVRDGNGK